MTLDRIFRRRALRERRMERWARIAAGGSPPVGDREDEGDRSSGPNTSLSTGLSTGLSAGLSASSAELDRDASSGLEGAPRVGHMRSSSSASSSSSLSDGARIAPLFGASSRSASVASSPSSTASLSAAKDQAASRQETGDAARSDDEGVSRGIRKALFRDDDEAKGGPEGARANDAALAAAVSPATPSAAPSPATPAPAPAPARPLAPEPSDARMGSADRPAEIRPPPHPRVAGARIAGAWRAFARGPGTSRARAREWAALGIDLGRVLDSGRLGARWDEESGNSAAAPAGASPAALPPTPSPAHRAAAEAARSAEGPAPPEAHVSVVAPTFDADAALLSNTKTLRVTQRVLARVEQRLRAAGRIAQAPPKPAGAAPLGVPRDAPSAAAPASVPRRRGGLPPGTRLSRFPVRAFLGAVMVLVHPQVVLSGGHAGLEEELVARSRAIVKAFAGVLRASGEAADADAGAAGPAAPPPAPSALLASAETFDSLWRPYLIALNAWKSADAAELEGELVRMAVALEVSRRRAILGARSRGLPEFRRRQRDLEDLDAATDADLARLRGKVRGLGGRPAEARLDAALRAAGHEVGDVGRASDEPPSAEPAPAAGDRAPPDDVSTPASGAAMPSPADPPVAGSPAATATAFQAAAPSAPTFAALRSASVAAAPRSASASVASPFGGAPRASQTRPFSARHYASFVVKDMLASQPDLRLLWSLARDPSAPPGPSAEDDLVEWRDAAVWAWKARRQAQWGDEEEEGGDGETPAPRATQSPGGTVRLAFGASGDAALSPSARPARPRSPVPATGANVESIRTQVRRQALRAFWDGVADHLVQDELAGARARDAGDRGSPSPASRAPTLNHLLEEVSSRLERSHAGSAWPGRRDAVASGGEALLQVEHPAPERDGAQTQARALAPPAISSLTDPALPVALEEVLEAVRTLGAPARDAAALAAAQDALAALSAAQAQVSAEEVGGTAGQVGQDGGSARPTAPLSPPSTPSASSPNSSPPSTPQPSAAPHPPPPPSPPSLVLLARAAASALRLAHAQLDMMRHDALRALLGALRDVPGVDPAERVARRLLEALPADEPIAQVLPRTAAWLAAGAGRLAALDPATWAPAEASAAAAAASAAEQSAPASMRSGRGVVQRPRAGGSAVTAVRGGVSGASSDPSATLRVLPAPSGRPRPLMRPAPRRGWRAAARVGLTLLVAEDGALGTPGAELPELLEVEADRLGAAQAAFQQLVVVAASLLLLGQSAKAAGAGAVPAGAASPFSPASTVDPTQAVRHLLAAAESLDASAESIAQAILDLLPRPAGLPPRASSPAAPPAPAPCASSPTAPAASPSPSASSLPTPLSPQTSSCPSVASLSAALRKLTARSSPGMRAISTALCQALAAHLLLPEPQEGRAATHALARCGARALAPHVAALGRCLREIAALEEDAFAPQLETLAAGQL